MRLRLIARVIVASALMPTLSAAATLERHIIVVGANNGGVDRPRLRYAISDAERFARVMTELGGVETDNATVLREPRVGDLLRALDALKARLELGRAQRGASAANRTEVFLYYSGHADEKGLLLGEDRLSYATLRQRLDEMKADVRIAVLDACASGAFTRVKGGRSRPAFTVDETSAARGHAFLTSSSETESAQESDRIRASYFTHYLVSGFRGAADTSGDGRVTLNEAYQFAFAETLGRTVDTKGGAQHPSFDINLSGAGDVVITDVRQTNARLVLTADLEGRFYVRVPNQGLVVELYKPRGRRVELALEAGMYEVRVEAGKTSLVATTTLTDGERMVLDAARFGIASREATQLRGADTPDSDSQRTYSENGGGLSVAHRNRISLQTGFWGSHGTTMRIYGAGMDIVGSMHYTRFLSERLNLTAGFAAFGAEAQVDLIGGFAVPIELRWNPRHGDVTQQRVKPYLAGGVMPVSSADFLSERRTTVGGRAGAGIDVHISHSKSLTFGLNYNAVPTLRPVQLHDNFGGVEFTTGIGFLFGGVR